jgi:hypothetical protein
MEDVPEKGLVGQAVPGPPASPVGSAPETATTGEWAKGLEKLFKAIGVALALAGFLFGLVRYFNQRKDELDQRQTQSENELKQRLREYRLQLHIERDRILRPLCQTVGEIVSAGKLKDADEHVHNFWVLYWGMLHTLDDPDVQKAKEEFGKVLMEANPEEPASADLLSTAGQLVQACQKSLSLDKVFDVPHE